MPGRLTLQELTDAAGVSVRTVRYYITEGLLPPALGAGPNSFYSPAHLDRLRLIGRLKDGYLPLKEIRRRLAGVDDATVARLLMLDEAELFLPSTWANPGGARAVREEPAAYAERTATAATSAPLIEFSQARRRPAGPEAVAAEPPFAADYDAVYADAEDAFDEVDWAQSHDVPWDAPTAPPTPARAAPSPRHEEGQTVRRFDLGEGAELTIPEDLLRRRREHVEWLLRWARKVFR